jgi:hypothetical protein
MYAVGKSSHILDHLLVVFVIVCVLREHVHGPVLVWVWGAKTARPWGSLPQAVDSLEANIQPFHLARKSSAITVFPVSRGRMGEVQPIRDCFPNPYIQPPCIANFWSTCKTTTHNTLKRLHPEATFHINGRTHRHLGNKGSEEWLICSGT